MSTAARIAKPHPRQQSSVSAVTLRAVRVWLAIASQERCAMNRRRAKVAARHLLADLRRDRITHAGTPGQVAYETDRARRPHYADGTARPTWAALSDAFRANWERHPSPRFA